MRRSGHARHPMRPSHLRRGPRPDRRANSQRCCPQRDDESEKRRSGAPLIIAGSPQFPGCRRPVRARRRARAGAGYVTVATPPGAAAALRAAPHRTSRRDVRRRRAGRNRRDLRPARPLRLDRNRAGIGLSTTPSARSYERDRTSRIADRRRRQRAFHLSKRLDILRGKRVVLTPHAGEFARLSGGGTVMPHHRLARLRAFVAQHDITTLLKGRSTLIADRHRVHVYPPARPRWRPPEPATFSPASSPRCLRRACRRSTPRARAPTGTAGRAALPRSDGRSA